MANKYVFRIDEISDGVLIGLTPLIKRLPVDDIVSWRFREVDLDLTGAPFEIPFRVFERIMSGPHGAISVPSVMFDEFLQSDFHVMDGLIDAFAANSAEPIFTLEAVDSSCWFIHTESEELAAELERRGFQRVDDDGR